MTALCKAPEWTVHLIDGPMKGRTVTMTHLGRRLIAPFVWTDGQMREAIYHYTSITLPARILMASLESVREM